MLIFSKDLPSGNELIKNNIRDCQERLSDWDTNETFLAQRPDVREKAKKALKTTLAWWEQKLINGYLSMNYHEYIHSEMWRSKKAQIIRDAHYRCQECGSTMRLQCHHISYERLGKELDSDLAVLCEVCHKELHNARKESVS